LLKSLVIGHLLKRRGANLVPVIKSTKFVICQNLTGQKPPNKPKLGSRMSEKTDVPNVLMPEVIPDFTDNAGDFERAFVLMSHDRKYKVSLA
jgi:hypothetical protein